MRAIVTGGGGFVGKAIVMELTARGVDCEVVGRNRYPFLEEKGIPCHRGDITDSVFVQNIFNNRYDVVFHVAALAGIWGDWDDYYNINVIGTKNVVAGCLANNIKALVHTSTPSVVFQGDDIENGDENLSYPQSFLCHYAKTKVMAEQMVLDMDQERIKCCAIRPHLVWGPGDPHLIPRIIARGQARDLKIVGTGKNIVDISYIDNVARAHVLAAEELLGMAKCAGKPYFIGQEKPVVLWDWINGLFQKIGVEKITRKVPFKAAYGAGVLLELVHRVCKLKSEPKMTRFVAEQLAKSHYFSHQNAARDFNFKPVVSIDEGMDRLIHWLKNDTNLL